MGNHRTNAKGFDLNRHYNFAPSDDNKRELRSYPELVYIKEMVRKCKEERDIAFFGDLHGHK